MDYFKELAYMTVKTDELNSPGSTNKLEISAGADTAAWGKASFLGSLCFALEVFS